STYGKLNTRSGIEDAGTCYRVSDCIAEFCVSEADRVRVAAGDEVQSDRVHRGVSHVGERLIRIRDEREHTTILIEGEAVKHLVVVADLPIEPRDTLSLPERGVESSG